MTSALVTSYTALAPGRAYFPWGGPSENSLLPTLVIARAALRVPAALGQPGG